MIKNALAFTFVLLLQFNTADIGAIVNALRSGNAAQLEPFMDSKVTLTINNQINTYSKKDAVEMITSFFQKNPVNHFQLLHQSESSGSQYFIGNLGTQGGTFRTTVYLKSKDGTWLIKEIQFE